MRIVARENKAAQLNKTHCRENGGQWFRLLCGVLGSGQTAKDWPVCYDVSYCEVSEAPCILQEPPEPLA